MEKRTLYEIRKEKGLLQKEVAEASYVSTSFYSFVERGERIPSMRAANKMALILGISLDGFFKAITNIGTTKALITTEDVTECASITTDQVMK